MTICQTFPQLLDVTKPFSRFAIEGGLEVSGVRKSAHTISLPAIDLTAFFSGRHTEMGEKGREGIKPSEHLQRAVRSATATKPAHPAITPPKRTVPDRTRTTGMLRNKRYHSGLIGNSALPDQRNDSQWNKTGI